MLRLASVARSAGDCAAVASSGRAKPFAHFLSYVAGEHRPFFFKVNKAAKVDLRKERAALSKIVDLVARRAVGVMQEDMDNLGPLWKKRHIKFDNTGRPDESAMSREVDLKVQSQRWSEITERINQDAQSQFAAPSAVSTMVAKEQESKAKKRRMEAKNAKLEKKRLKSPPRQVDKKDGILSWDEAVDRAVKRNATRTPKAKTTIYSRPFPKHNIVLSKEEVEQRPINAFPGRIVEVSKMDQVDEAIRMLSMETTLGFDTETRPVFLKGSPQRPVCLVQLSTSTHAFLFRLNTLETIPRGLQDILESADYLKVAHSSVPEMKELWRQYNVKCRNFVDIFEMGRSMGVKPLNLRALCAVFLGFRISKDCQTSNWERPELDAKQKSYAATDAWVSREIFFAMTRHLAGNYYHQHSTSAADVSKGDDGHVADKAVQTVDADARPDSPPMVTDSISTKSSPASDRAS